MQMPEPLPPPTAPGLRRRAVTRLLATAPLALRLPAADAAPAAKPILIQFSHVVAPQTAKGQAALRFKELAETRTAGQVRVEVYPNSTLYKDGEEVEALRLGAVQMLATSLSKLAKWGGGDFELFDLPFLFKDQAAFHAAVEGPAGAALLRQLEHKGIQGLAYWDNGFKVFTANRPLQAVGDFKGLTFRVQASRVLVQQMQALGAQTSVSPLIDVRGALQEGRLDGQENTASNIYTQGLHEVQRHLTLSHHGYLAYAVLVNKTFWARLPAGIRLVLDGALRDATAFANSMATAENTRALERIRASGRMTIHTPTPQERESWRAAMLPVYQASSRWIRPEALSAFRAAMGAPP